MGEGVLIIINSGLIPGFLGGSMFDSLADQMKKDDKETTNSTQRIVLWVGVAAASIVVFGGLYMGVRMLG
jgi:hypothetical protein